MRRVDVSVTRVRREREERQEKVEIMMIDSWIEAEQDFRFKVRLSTKHLYAFLSSGKLESS